MAFTAKSAKSAKNGESRGNGTTNGDHHGGTEIEQWSQQSWRNGN